MADLATDEPVAVTVRRWLCPFCRRGRSSRRATAGHIARCWLNPANRGCKTCAHYAYYRGGPGCEQGGPGCSCDQSLEECERGCSLASGLRTGCPLWSLRPETADA